MEKLKVTMAVSIQWALLLVCLLPALSRGQALVNDLALAQDALDKYNAEASMVYYADSEASWAFNTNITDYNRRRMLDASLKSAAFAKESAANLSIFNISNMPDIMKREFHKIRDIGFAALDNQTELKTVNEILSEMESIYSTAKACLSSTECLPLEPDLTRLLKESRNYERLLKAWTSWRDASGARMKSLYAEFVKISNKAAQFLGYEDTGAYWRSSYEMPDFEEQVRGLFEQLRPLYEHLHAFVRRRLKKLYGEDKFPSTGQIPAHLLGNMWAQEWDSIKNELMPYSDKAAMDVTDEMVRQKYTSRRIFETADAFFGSLGLIRMPNEFWEKSMLEKPEGREVVCHASAWDFYNGKDFRIKQCTDVTQAHFETAHHEMGHIEYYLQYKNQPLAFRSGANPGFHEAVGDVMSLSVQTPEHMHSIGLLPTLATDAETDINFLMGMALTKIAFLPFGYLIDQWRWSVFRGDTTPDQYTEKWWDLRCSLQGISPPVARSSSDFDPGAKYHIPANTPYIRYFVSFVIQFQFHKTACQAAGYSGPLHRCDIYNSTDAGRLIADMLKLGSSKPWPDAMEQMTGQRVMDAQPLIDYFQPLLEFLRTENGVDVGWQAACPTSFPDSAEANAFHLGLLIMLQLLLFSLM